MPAWIVPAAIAAGQLIAGAIGQNKQNKDQKRLAAYQAQMNERYLQQQLEYNSPKAQMARYQDAGLNAHLIYSQGNPGNQAAPLSAPQQNPSRYDAIGNSLAPMSALANQTAMTQSQTAAIDAKTRQTHALTALAKLQADVLSKNPLLDEAGFNAIISSLVSSAEIKAAESGIKQLDARLLTKTQMSGGKDDGLLLGEVRLFRELDLLEQRFKLGTLDAKLKAEVLTSKEFANAIAEVQKKWMTEGDITPQHILQFIQLLLMKML